MAGGSRYQPLPVQTGHPFIRAPLPDCVYRGILAVFRSPPGFDCSRGVRRGWSCSSRCCSVLYRHRYRGQMVADANCRDGPQRSDVSPSVVLSDRADRDVAEPLWQDRTADDSESRFRHSEAHRRPSDRCALQSEFAVVTTAKQAVRTVAEPSGGRETRGDRFCRMVKISFECSESAYTTPP